MIPLVFSDHEVDEITPSIMRIAHETCYAAGHSLNELGIELGAMIEVPRACIRADRIAMANYMSFISFGSNDLTQLTFGMSRDDTQQYLVSLILSLSPSICSNCFDLSLTSHTI
jgi:pyruvate,orthophosphate dikinase